MRLMRDATPRAAARARRHTAFTLLEILVTLTVIAAIAAVVMPLMSDDSRLRVMAASSLVTSDIEAAQVMTIATPDKPVVVRFDPDTSTYWLAYATTPDTPITRDDTGEAYQVTLGQGRARAAGGVNITLESVTANTITFAAHGGLNDFTATPVIRLARNAQGIQLTIAPNTGSITESEFTPSAPPPMEAEGG
jgi:prepilin-type N-terminal cleavage/methylation domain-containing protein